MNDHQRTAYEANIRYREAMQHTANKVSNNKGSDSQGANRGRTPKVRLHGAGKASARTKYSILR